MAGEVIAQFRALVLIDVGVVAAFACARSSAQGTHRPTGLHT